MGKTQSEIKFYETLLFKDAIWRNVIDTAVEYNFDHSKAAFGTVLLGHVEGAEQVRSERVISKLLVPTQFSILSQSPLFSSSSLFSQSVEASSEPAGSNYSDELGVSQGAVAGLDDYVISLELNDVNKQLVMGNLLRVMQRIAVLFSPLWAQQRQGASSSSSSLPPIVLHIQKRLEDVSSHQNIRLFFLRLCLNQPVCTLLSPFASEVLTILQYLKLH